MDSNAKRASKDPSLKARKDLFFDDTPLAGAESDTPRKPFKDYVRETPATPLPPLIKAGLWAAAAVVALLMLVAMYRISQPRKPKTPQAEVERVVAPERRWG